MQRCSRSNAEIRAFKSARQFIEKRQEEELAMNLTANPGVFNGLTFSDNGIPLIMCKCMYAQKFFSIALKCRCNLQGSGILMTSGAIRVADDKPASQSP